MPDWKLWWEMAVDSIKAARDLEKSFPRSAVSRAYYGAYQASTAFLLYRKQVPPDTREAWSHIETPDMLATHLTEVSVPKGRANDTAQKLKVLYKARTTADYTSAVSVTWADAQGACKRAGAVVKVIEGLLSGKQDAGNQSARNG